MHHSARAVLAAHHRASAACFHGPSVNQSQAELKQLPACASIKGLRNMDSPSSPLRHFFISPAVQQTQMSPSVGFPSPHSSRGTPPSFLHDLLRRLESCISCGSRESHLSQQLHLRWRRNWRKEERQEVSDCHLNSSCPPILASPL